jgi:DNA helicase HerA-like ATPase
MLTKPLPVKTALPTPESFGTVIALPTGNSPNVLEFMCILAEQSPQSTNKPRQGQFCVTSTIEGLLIGKIEQIQTSNTYFQDAQTVKNFAASQLNLREYFPSDQWECHIAVIGVLGLVPDITTFNYALDPLLFRRLEKPGFPAKPGKEVYILDGEFLKHFLGFDERGLAIGELKYSKLPIKVDMNRLFNKHVAILAQSGAGKSYLLSVLLEEILMRDERLGRPGMVLFDIHGEYRFMSERLDRESIPDLKRRAELEEIQKRIQHFSASFLQIGVPYLNEYDFQKFQPAISLPQLRVLRKALDACRKKFKSSANPVDSISPPPDGFDLKDLIFIINDDPDINPKVKEALVGWLADLDHMGIFVKNEAPSIFELVRPGQLSIIDMSTITSQRKKQMLAHYFASRLFYGRRSGGIAPFILFLEEAHNFLPEAGGNHAIAKGIFETIAREGRKFFAQLVLVSQRPVHLSTTALSQCNSQIIMRITNPYDLDHVKKTSENLSSEGVKIITTLPTGSGLLVGAAINYPVFFKVRTRILPNVKAEMSLAEICQEYQKKEEFNALRPPSMGYTTAGMLRDDELLDMDISIQSESE